MSDPSEFTELVEAALKPWGWTCSPEFWQRYHTDPWVFNLTNALTRVTFRDASAVVPEVGPPASGTATRAARAETGPHGVPAVAAGPHPFRLIHPAGGSGCAPST